MTDEEMAEEYAEKECKNCSYRCDKPNVFKRLSNKKECHAYFRSYEGYLAGLKAGRPQWHKIADGDLPKIGKPCFIYLANDYVIIAKLREDNVWTTNGHNAFENVIAWCELPTFDKE